MPCCWAPLPLEGHPAGGESSALQGLPMVQKPNDLPVAEIRLLRQLAEEG